MKTSVPIRLLFVIAITLGLLPVTFSYGQALQFADLPGADKVTEATTAYSSIQSAYARNLNWTEDGSKLYFTAGDGRQVIDLASGDVAGAESEPAAPDRSRSSDRRQRRGGVGRAQQRTTLTSPDGRWKAVYRDHNIWMQTLNEDGEPEGEPKALTTEGTEKHRFGTACWVYGEELFQQDAMWFSDDSSKFAYYEIDEEHMKPYYLTVGNAALYTDLHVEQYPTAGQDNPHVKLHIHDLTTGNTVAVQVEGPEDQYLYGIEFSPDSSELIFHRTNRWQNVMDLMAANAETGEVRTIVTESQETWQNNSPTMRYLDDGERFVWETERTGWKQYELRHLDGRLLAKLTQDADYAVDQIISIEEDAGWFYYTAFSDDNRLNVQLHRSRLDGSESRRLTPDSWFYSGFQIAPHHKAFVASYESTSQPASTGVFDMEGNQIGVLAAADPDAFEEAGCTPPELFTFTADDGKTTIYGQLFKPRNFDPDKTYPLLIDVYGGPHSVGVTNRFRAGNPYCDLGFLIAKIGNRGTMNLGKAFESATYMQLGIVDMDDQAAGVRHLAERSYVDGSRVGIYGHSYGGYMSALALLRYPDVFHVGVAGAPVTDWKNYDTIYTERYMRTPQENPEGYKAGSCIELAGNLKGKLFILHGLVDDNVHPSNTWQLVDALQKKNMRFDLMVYPNNAHGFSYQPLRWEYFVRHLNPEP